MIKHKHHIIPRHAGGTDDQSNIIEVDIQTHALLHKELFELHGRWQDKLAWKMLSGQIDDQEALSIKLKEGGRITGRKNKGKPRSEEIKQKISKSKTGKV